MQNPDYSKYLNEPPLPNGKLQGEGFGLASVVLGMLSLMIFLSGLNVLSAGVGCALGAVQLRRYEKRSLGIAGILLCVASILLSLAGWLVLALNVVL